MNLRTYKPLLALAALAFGLAACNSEELDTGTSPHGDGQLTITAADTRSVAEDANISVKIGTTTHAYTLKADGTLTPPTTKPLIEPGTKTLDIHAWGTVKWDFDGDSKTTGDRTDMYVIHQNAATPVAWSATGPSVELRLAAATALIRLNVTDSDGDNITEGATMPGAKIAAWGTGDKVGTVVAGNPDSDLVPTTFDATGLLQIMPGAKVEVGKPLFTKTINSVDKILYATKSYTFLAGTEYTFNVRITTKGEAILEGFTIKEMEEGPLLGNYMMYINSIEDLRTFRDRVNDGETSLNAIQTADIVMEDKDKTVDGGWVPIGDYQKLGNPEYAGTYNGGGYTITGLTINRNAGGQGLFGRTNGATLTAIRLKDVNVKATSENTGALAGAILKSKVNKCSVESSTVNGHGFVGGLAGQIIGNTIVVSCFSTASVTATGNFVGGLVGGNSESIIAFCYATGSVEGYDGIGGLAGGSGSTIISCYATGAVTATGTNKGSLVGRNNSGSITYCHAVPNGNATQLVGNVGMDGTCSTDDDEAGDTVRSCPDTEVYGGFKASTAWASTGDEPQLTWQ